MKRVIFAWMLALGLALLCGAALAEDKPIYTAVVNIDCNIRLAPEAEYRVKQLYRGDTVNVLEYGDDWCRVTYGKEEGWLKTRWLCVFWSRDPLHYQVPGLVKLEGTLTMTRATGIKGGEFEGVTAEKGTVVCASPSAAGYWMPVWRGDTAVKAESGDFAAFVPWEDAQPGDVIAGFTTFYNEKTGWPLAAERAYNIVLACRRINGAVILPGQTCSFNGLCGKYSYNGGYKVAPNVSKEGKGYGGGVCQVTTTLFNAALALPLRISDWSVHQLQGVRYIPESFDAAVGNSQDFQFVNTLPYGIRLWAKPQGGCVTVLILRAEE